GVVATAGALAGGQSTVAGPGAGSPRSAPPPGRCAGPAARRPAPGRRAETPAGRVSVRDRTAHGSEHGGGRGLAPARAEGPPRDARRFLLSRRRTGEATMAGDTQTMADRQQRLERAVGDYLEALDAGRAPDPGPWLARFPDLQPELDQFLADQ